MEFAEGDRVQLTDLVARAELNGKAGLVLGFDEALQRYIVELERHSSWDERSVQIKLKPANLLRRDSADECAICMCEAVRPVRLSCGHVFCESCMVRLRTRAAQDPALPDACPLCRATLGDDAEKYFLRASIEVLRLESTRHTPFAHEKGSAPPLSQSVRALLERAIEHDPDHVGSLIMLGELLVDSEPERAVATLQRAVSLDASESCAHLELGKALEAVGDLEGALASNERAAGCIGVSEVTRAAALMQSAVLHEEAGRQDAAIECYRQAEAATPDDHVVPFNLAVCLEESDVEGAIVALERTLKLEPTFYQAYYALSAGYNGGLYRRRIIANGQLSEGLSAQLWASSALTAARLAPRGPEASEERSNIQAALEKIKAAFQMNYKNVVERMDGTVTPRHVDVAFNDCNSFARWADEHNRMMAARWRG